MMHTFQAEAGSGTGRSAERARRSGRSEDR